MQKCNKKEDVGHAKEFSCETQFLLTSSSNSCSMQINQSNIFRIINLGRLINRSFNHSFLDSSSMCGKMLTGS